jgi:LmbE family N-acetylglucosaminyl deacetylase
VLDAVDILVFAPHPDDEVIGCAGVIQHALQAGKRVRVAFSTDGDGYPRAASVLCGKPESALTLEDFWRLGEARRREAVAAASVLGVGPSSLVFLGYPDGAFDKVLSNAGPVPVRSTLTGRTSTDRRTPHTHRAALEEFEEIISSSEAAALYVTDRADEHPDHRATHDLVLEAMETTGSRARLLSYVVHSGGLDWPTPGATFETRDIDGVTYPAGVGWPPPIRVQLTPEEASVKLRALKAHASQWTIDHEYMGSFVKSEEIFWG